MIDTSCALKPKSPRRVACRGGQDAAAVPKTSRPKQLTAAEKKRQKQNAGGGGYICGRAGCDKWGKCVCEMRKHTHKKTRENMTRVGVCESPRRRSNRIVPPLQNRIVPPLQRVPPPQIDPLRFELPPPPIAPPPPVAPPPQHAPAPLRMPMRRSPAPSAERRRAVSGGSRLRAHRRDPPPPILDPPLTCI